MTSGNAVSSEIINLSYTKGNENTPKIDLSLGVTTKIILVLTKTLTTYSWSKAKTLT